MATIPTKDAYSYTGSSPVSLNVSSSLKKDVDDLARSANMTTSELLITYLVVPFVEANQDRIKAFRELASAPLISPFDGDE